MFFSKQKKRNLRINLFISSSHKRKRGKKSFLYLKSEYSFKYFFSCGTLTQSAPAYSFSQSLFFASLVFFSVFSVSFSSFLFFFNFHYDFSCFLAFIHLFF